LARQISGNSLNPNRNRTDLYPTHPVWTRALLDNVEFKGPVLEPASGYGDMVRVLEEHGYSVTASDILEGDDFLERTEPWVGDIITNPPYKLADEFIHHAMSLASGRVAMLLPIGSLGGINRYKNLWSVKPPEVVLIISRRMPVGGKTSQFNHIWCVWPRPDDVKDTKVLWVEGVLEPCRARNLQK